MIQGKVDEQSTKTLQKRIPISSKKSERNTIKVFIEM